MNKKVLVIAVALMAVAMLAVPVMAAPATKVEASTEALSSISYPGPEFKVTVTKSGVVHVRGINYINTRTLTIGVDTYDVYAVGSYDVNWNPKTGTAVCHFTAVWYVGSLTGTTDNGFSGNTEIKVFNVANPETMEGDYTTSRQVMQGFGSFAQYTLKLSYEGPCEGGTNPSGYCIIP